MSYDLLASTFWNDTHL